eukprot:1217095-Prorocentrum_lima.AAC.1
MNVESRGLGDVYKRQSFIRANRIGVELGAPAVLPGCEAAWPPPIESVSYTHLTLPTICSV